MEPDIQKSEKGIRGKGDNTASLLKKLLDIAFGYSFSTAIWRLPNQKAVHLLIDTGRYQKISEIDLERMSKGFLFCPFDTGEKVFIRSDIHFESDKPDIAVAGNVSASTKLKLDKLYGQDTVHELNATYFTDNGSAPVNETTHKEYLRVVEASIAAIHNNVFEKVVPSRIKEIKFHTKFSVVDNFIKLTNAYPRTFVFFVSIPGIGSWMGATPEALIEIEDGRTFRTVSLAGTQKYHEGIITSEVAWTQKDIEEQAMVSRYIINCFKKIRLREFVEHGPKTVIAGNLMHLKTTYEVDLHDTGFSNLGTVMLQLLHPTSAVCGMPKDASSKFLDTHESHNRKYYSGFLGPVDNHINTHIFVNIRSMELFEDRAVLYAGSGITEDSNPEKEWLETEMKCNTLLNVIRSS